MVELIQSLAAVGGLALGFTYILGGLIVNVYLSRFGVTEYRVVRAKYLVVGLVYLVNLAADFLLAAIPAFLLAALPLLTLQIAAGVSLVASVWLLLLWAKKTIRRRIFAGWWFWIVISAVAALFPLTVLFRTVLIGAQGPTEVLLSIEGVVIGLLAITGQAYYFARFLYGDPTVFGGAVDTTGSGASAIVRLAGKPEEMKMLWHMGVPQHEDDLSDDVLLLDETEDHYIIGIPVGTPRRAIKVSKELVKGILYHGYFADSAPAKPKRE